MHTVIKPPTDKYYDYTEYCPHCDNEIPVVIDYNLQNPRYERKCPICGKRLMLCTLCLGAGFECNWNATGGCMFYEKE